MTTIDVIVDTREQLPYTFRDFEDIKTVSQKLDTGDYSLNDCEDFITVERKTCEDFLNSITNDRERFEKEFERMKEIKYSFCIIECSLIQAYKHIEDKGTFSPEAILGTVASWSMKYNTQFLFTNNRKFGEKVCYRILKNAVKLIHNN